MLYGTIARFEVNFSIQIEGIGVQATMSLGQLALKEQRRIAEQVSASVSEN